MAVASVESGEQIKIANGSNCPTCANLYVNDVLYYASFYGGGTLLGDPNTCGRGSGNPKLPSLTNERVAKLLAWAKRHDGDRYRMGTAGPNTGECSSFTQAER